MMVLGWLVFIVALLASVMLHEAGHFAAAKRFGMPVSEFFVGFGPRVWSFFRGETEYGLKALPAGGYVKIIGMTPLEPVPERHRSRVFYLQRGWKRLIVLCAGSFMHFVLAFVLLLVIAMGLGLNDDEHPTTEIDQLSACVPASATAPCHKSDPESPAKKAGLRPGDKIVGFAGKPVHSWKRLSSSIRAHKPGPVGLTVERHGQRLHKIVVLAKARDKRGRSFLGVNAKMPIVRDGPIKGAKFAATSMGSMFAAVGQVIGDLPAAIPHLFSANRGSTPGGSAGSVVGAARFSGDVVAQQHTPWRAKVGELLLLVVSLNVFVGVFNMLPLLPLDGGHVAVVLYERAKHVVMRLRGKPEPGPVDIAKLLPLTYVVFVLLVGLGATLILADIVNPLKLQ